VRVVAEGAGALATAAALAGEAGAGKVVCIVSGGNINLATLAEILMGGTAISSIMHARRVGGEG
jgi:threonine dehydratase